MNRLRGKALAYLRDGRVTIRTAASNMPLADGRRLVSGAYATVAGHQGLYVVELVAGLWFCTAPPCAARNPRTDPPCPHIAAVQLVTGHATGAVLR